MTRLGDTITTVRGLQGKIIALQWKDKEVYGYSVETTDGIYFIYKGDVK